MSKLGALPYWTSLWPIHLNYYEFDRKVIQTTCTAYDSVIAYPCWGPLSFVTPSRISWPLSCTLKLLCILWKRSYEKRKQNWMYMHLLFNVWYIECCTRKRLTNHLAGAFIGHCSRGYKWHWGILGGQWFQRKSLQMNSRPSCRRV